MASLVLMPTVGLNIRSTFHTCWLTDNKQNLRKFGKIEVISEKKLNILTSMLDFSMTLKLFL